MHHHPFARFCPGRPLPAPRGGEVLIALFDSGVGGLTVLQSLRRRLPERDYLYMCDQAHFPYGDRPPADVRHSVARFAEIALERGAEALVLACNTATAMALQEARAVFGPHTYGVIGAAGQSARQRTARERVGVLATTNTCRSHAYRTAVGGNIEVVEVACPDLIALAEVGGASDKAIDAAAKEPLEVLRSAGVDVVVLGCTHLPHFEERLRILTSSFARLIDPGEEVAQEIVRELPQRSEHSAVECLTTGDAHRLSRRFQEIFPRVRATFAQISIVPDRPGGGFVDGRAD